MCRRADVQIRRCADVQKCEHADVQTCRSAEVQKDDESPRKKRVSLQYEHNPNVRDQLLCLPGNTKRLSIMEYRAST
jgi:hypothetical protein